LIASLIIFAVRQKQTIMEQRRQNKELKQRVQQLEADLRSRNAAYQQLVEKYGQLTKNMYTDVHHAVVSALNSSGIKAAASQLTTTANTALQHTSQLKSAASLLAVSTQHSLDQTRSLETLITAGEWRVQSRQSQSQSFSVSHPDADADPEEEAEAEQDDKAPPNYQQFEPEATTQGVGE
jgi:hypothetical protein